MRKRGPGKRLWALYPPSCPPDGESWPAGRVRCAGAEGWWRTQRVVAWPCVTVRGWAPPSLERHVESRTEGFLLRPSFVLSGLLSEHLFYSSPLEGSLLVFSCLAQWSALLLTFEEKNTSSGCPLEGPQTQQPSSGKPWPCPCVRHESDASNDDSACI